MPGCAKKAAATSAPESAGYAADASYGAGGADYASAEASADGAAPGAYGGDGGGEAEAEYAASERAPEPEPAMEAPMADSDDDYDGGSKIASRRAERRDRKASRDALRIAKPAPPAPPRGGILTAGTFDDTLNPGVFATFMAGMSNNPATAEVARHFVGPMTTITVVDPSGRAVADANVEVRTVSQQARHDKLSRSIRSGTDGRAIAIGGYDYGSGKLQARVNSGAWRSITAGSRETFAVQGQAKPIRALDVALVVDATGSMGDELDYLKLELRNIVAEIKSEFPNVDQRFALVVYRDEGDEYVSRDFDFSGDLARFERRLGKQSANGGGDYPEAMDAALEDAADLSWRTGPDTARVTFVIADAPPHTQDMAATMTAVEELRSIGVAMYPVAASGVASEAEMVMRAAAASTGGQYVFLTDDSGVGNSHAEPHIPCYEVEMLREAMSRMLVTELAGRRIDAFAQDTIRRVGHSTAGVCTPTRRRAN